MLKCFENSYNCCRKLMPLFQWTSSCDSRRKRISWTASSFTSQRTWGFFHDFVFKKNSQFFFLFHDFFLISRNRFYIFFENKNEIFSYTFFAICFLLSVPETPISTVLHAIAQQAIYILIMRPLNSKIELTRFVCIIRFWILQFVKQRLGCLNLRIYI